MKLSPCFPVLPIGTGTGKTKRAKKRKRKRKWKELTVGNLEAKQGDEEECGDV